MQYISQDPHLSSKKLTSIAGVSAVKVRENFAKLKSAGIVERVGSDRGGHWKTIK